MNRSSAPRKDPANGTWWFVVDLPPGEDGKRRQVKRRGFRTRAEAQQALDELRVAARQGTFVRPHRQTVREYLEDEWLPAVQRQLAVTTWESYARNVRHHLVPEIGHVQLQALDGADLNRLYDKLIRSGRVRGTRSPGLKPRTVRYIATILHKALDDAVKWRRVQLNAADQATPPSARSAKPPEMKARTGPQLAAFLQRTKGDRYGYAWGFLATTGCRRGEALGLRWSDVDLDAASASLRQQVIPVTKPGGVGRGAGWCPAPRAATHG